MADEQPPRLVICDAYWEGEGVLKADVSYFESGTGDYLRVRFNEQFKPDGFTPVGNGVAFLYTEEKRLKELQKPESKGKDLIILETSRASSTIKWAEGLPSNIKWQMLIFIFPGGFAPLAISPKPSGAKEFNDRIAVFWFVQGRVGEIPRTEILLRFAKFPKDRLSDFVRHINKQSSALGLREMHVIEDPEEIKALMKNHNRRLQTLTEEKVLFGPETSVGEEIARDIENIERELDDLQNQLRDHAIMVKLYPKISESFDRNELYRLCFEFGLDKDNFSTDKDSLIREIIGYFRRHGEISRLVEYCQKNRPNITWQ